MVIPYYCEDYPENPDDLNDAESPFSPAPSNQAIADAVPPETANRRADPADAQTPANSDADATR